MHKIHSKLDFCLNKSAICKYVMFKCSWDLHYKNKYFAKNLILYACAMFMGLTYKVKWSKYKYGMLQRVKVSGQSVAPQWYMLCSVFIHLYKR